MPCTKKRPVVCLCDIKPPKNAPKNGLEIFLIIPLADLEAGKLFSTGFFAIFGETWILCIIPRKTRFIFGGRMYFDKRLYRCWPNRVANFNLRVVDFKLVHFGVKVPEGVKDSDLWLQWPPPRDEEVSYFWCGVGDSVQGEYKKGKVPTSRDEIGLHWREVVEKPLSEMRRSYAKRGMVSFRVTLAFDTEPSPRDSVMDEKHPKLQSGAREFPKGVSTELKSRGDPDLDNEVATKQTGKPKIPVNIQIAFVSFNCLVVTAMQHSAFSWIWAIFDLIAFYVIYWGMYRKANGENIPTADDSVNANDYLMCLLLALVCTYVGVCYVSPFFFFAIYFLYTNRVTRTN